jgi:GYF domain 2
MSEAWYYANGENRVGPLSRKELVQALSQMPEASKPLVWRRGFSDWQKAAELAELFPYVAEPPPLPPAFPLKTRDSVLCSKRRARRGFSARHPYLERSVWLSR